MLRIAAGQRLVQQFKAKLGLDQTVKEDDEKQDKLAKKIIADLKAEHKKITDGVKKELPALKDFKAIGIISEYSELCLLHSYLMLEQQEDGQFARIKMLLDQVPIWNAFFKDIPGCGPAMAGALLATVKIEKARHPSSLHQYCGKGVHDDGRSMGPWETHLVPREYIDINGVKKTRQGLVYNPWLQSKMFVLAECLIKAGNEKYGKIYRDYKHRLQTSPNWAEDVKKAQWEKFRAERALRDARRGKPKSDKPAKPAVYAHKAHIDNASKTYMIKAFLTDLYVAWRTLEGLPVSEPYSVDKQGREPHGGTFAAGVRSLLVAEAEQGRKPHGGHKAA
jgi:hypothetical protein